MSPSSTLPRAADSPVDDRRQEQPSSGITPVAWVPARDIDLAEWTAVGRRLGTMGRCGQWGLGDWIRYGNTRFGEKYTRAAKITGYDVQTLTNMVYVASKFEISRRREMLSWSHHETLAALDPHDQNFWLERAVAEKLSVADLRTELRSARRHSKTSTAGTDKPDDATATLVCPFCGNRVSLLPEGTTTSTSKLTAPSDRVC
jgi:hypothetical protein